MSTEDVDRYSACLADTFGAFTVCKHKSRGRLGFSGSLNMMSGVTAYDIAYSGDQTIVPDYPHEGHAVVVSLDGSLIIDEGGRRYAVNGQQAAAVWSTAVERVQVIGHSRHYGVHVEAQAVNDRLARLLERPVRLPFVFSPERELASVVTPTFIGLIQTLSNAQLPGAAEAALGLTDNLQTAVVDLLLRTTSHNHTEALARPPALIAPRYVKRAIEYMNANLTQAVSQDDIADAAGVGVRALQYGFQRFVGASPMEHMRALRLAGARRDLERDRISSVAEIAAKWRFSNPGRFAAMFAKAYGVGPSEFREGWDRTVAYPVSRPSGAESDDRQVPARSMALARSGS
ncbi:AraC family transcriptional regulator [Caulobacter mirabilis]|uniref:AraC family transcriptional regulator n=1 Tax=Caulobacter mirabilis TaxID=69666 RepID=UPI0015588A67|nr:AraC family transcriptional regulator [Caulobacter mirabilis]